MKYKRIQGYILEQFPRSRKMTVYFEVYWTKKAAETAIKWLSRDARRKIYRVTVDVHENLIKPKRFL